MLALSRSGRSLVTTVTWRPSAARLWATVRMRWSLSSDRRPAGSVERSWWLSSTLMVPPCSVAEDRLGQRPVFDAEPFEGAERLPRRPPEVRVVALRLELDEHGDRDHDVVLVEAHQRPRVGQQHRCVEHVGTRRLGVHIGHGHRLRLGTRTHATRSVPAGGGWPGPPRTMGGGEGE